MSFQDEEVQTLTRLGLTSCQARVYLALVRSGISTAKEISKDSKVTRQDVYRVMPMLQKFDLTEKIITTPTKFKAIPIQDVISILLERRTKEISELRAKTKELVKKYGENKAKTKLQEGENEFVLIPKDKAIIKKRRNAIENAQTSIDVIISWKRYLPSILANAKVIKKALKRGVKIRYITEKTEDKTVLPKILQAVRENPFRKARYVLTPLKILLAIYDKKGVIIITSPTLGLHKSPALWSNNPSLVALAQNHFETLWTTSLEDKQEEH